MRVERVGLKAVKDRFKSNKRERESATAPKLSAMESYKAKIAALQVSSINLVQFEQFLTDFVLSCLERGGEDEAPEEGGKSSRKEEKGG
jgi:hypothetical protein